MKENNWVNPNYPDADKTIAIDFDGVIHHSDKGFHDGTVYGVPFYGVEASLKTLQAMGYKLVVHSSKARSDRQLVNGKTGKELIREWLQKYDLSQYIDGIESEKPSAFVYIDDNAFNFSNWGSFIRWITDYHNGVPKRKKRNEFKNDK